MEKNLFQKLPKVDILMKNEKLEEISKKLSYHNYYQAVKDGIEFFRNKIKNNEIENFSEDEIILKIKEISGIKNKLNLRRVINGTGTIIHTNLGRSILNEKITEDLGEILLNYSNLEYDLETGSRGSRYSHIEKLICEITGAEGALIVNNNAAAVILCLNEFANGKNTIVSRGELVEIGGSFRIPEIMKLAGTTLKEVGTTNKTHIFDYENNIDEETAVLLKVHTSNFKITGFTEGTDKKDIAELGKKHGLLTMEDLGSGVLVDFSKYGLSKEPTIQESIESGMDIVTVSGDKLLGGPQCGIILGKKSLIERLKKNQYLRAFRVNKVTISILENIFQYYKDEREAVKEIPVLNMITEKKEKVLERVEKLSFMLTEKNIENNVIETEAKIGGGSMPEETVESYAVCFNGDAVLLEKKFRGNDIPVIGRIKSDRFIIDAKTLKEKDFEEILGAAERIFL
ncbi:L-seryl-tRNA(Sec) selenium transferase [Fusobacterium varium]|uniref:L-seryl-tRNA(Sec) selenium transferase n=1 Tax=Fusobacterium varium TaxID=856 RepID=UPI002432322A|nr:L-seryl-tRNA(Sec) selenium transferase [Fusobacterium varium]MCI6031422.1 L-seryl-tRNA(Sec) selenium transferase [Fusobacterium varium]